MYIILILNEFVHMWCFVGPARQCRMYEKKYFPLIFTIFTNALIVKQFSLKKGVGLNHKWCLSHMTLHFTKYLPDILNKLGVKLDFTRKTGTDRCMSGSKLWLAVYLPLLSPRCNDNWMRIELRLPV